MAPRFFYLSLRESPTRHSAMATARGWGEGEACVAGMPARSRNCMRRNLFSNADRRCASCESAVERFTLTLPSP